MFWHLCVDIHGNCVPKMGGRERREVAVVGEVGGGGKDERVVVGEEVEGGGKDEMVVVVGENARGTLAFALVFSSSSLPAVLSLMLDCTCAGGGRCEGREKWNRQHAGSP
jgi:hypothetical protein